MFSARGFMCVMAGCVIQDSNVKFYALWECLGRATPSTYDEHGLRIAKARLYLRRRVSTVAFQENESVMLTKTDATAHCSQRM